MSKAYALIISVLLCIDVTAQETFTENGVRDERTESYAFINATIYVDHQTIYENGTLLIQDGKIIAVGDQVTVPQGYVVNDVKGKFIYPSLIEIYSSYGMPQIPKGRPFSFNSAEQMQSDIPGAYNANEAIKSHFIAAENFTADKKSAKSLRDMGFGTVSSFKADGIARGTSAVVTLGDLNENEALLKHHGATYYSFLKGSSSQSYPISIMGGVALLRQTHYDANWYASSNNVKFVDQSLEMFNRHKGLPQIMEVRDWQEAMTADKVGDDLGVQYIIKGKGDSYKRIAEIKSTKATLIVPLVFPKAPDVADPLEAERVTLKEMLHWELAPGNLAALANNNIPFVITGTGAKADFWKNLRKAIKRGLSKEHALEALTTSPANLLGVNGLVGDLRTGKLANFLITDDSLFLEKTSILEHWIRGRKYQVNDLPDAAIAGKYDLNISGTTYPLELKVSGKSVTGSVAINDSTDSKAKIVLDMKQIGLNFNPTPKDAGSLKIRLAGWLTGKNWSGSGQNQQGQEVSWSANYTGPLDADTTKKETKQSEMVTGSLIYPFTSYGLTSNPGTQNVLFRNATVWTNEQQGIVTATDVLVQQGKIAGVGQNLNPGNAKVVDATGMHLTSGIIDEHSHIALKNVNDIATVSSMVRMEDAIDSEDIDIYRQLAGGVSAAQLLHGSANPVGGQSAIVKLKWGTAPAGMLIPGAKPYIKFALGENVKRSSNRASVRYPQSRMGVEQVFMDGFSQAQLYGQQWQKYQALSSKVKVRTAAPRRDLALEAMSEILEGQRFITCHSYVQSEINMLMKVAEQFDFRVQTFTHILEGYKVADKMQAHGVGASTFADWWGYKYEVIEAIPYNAALMANQGVVTAINSDDAEMGRRLNQEAAKSIKYGGMTEEDAWKMVTLNPAKLLQLDHSMGSVKVGKDADLVLWTDNPLSIYATVDKNMIEGVIYFDRAQDDQQRDALHQERNRLIQKILQNGNGAGKGPMGKQPKPQLHCDDIIYEN